MSRACWRIGAIADLPLLDQAALWHERMRSAPNAATRRRFEAWLAANETHARAYETVRTAEEQAEKLSREPSIIALRQEALTRAKLIPARRRFGKSSIAAAVLLFATAPLAAWSFQHWFTRPVVPTVEETISTAVGQQTDVTLPDGSTVRLDTDSRLHVSFTSHERRVTLDGQGWFEVKPADRPFVIQAGGRELSAGAGRFDVRTDPGIVRAYAGSGTLSLTAGSSSIALGDGKLLTVSGDEAKIRRLDRPATFTGWRNGMLLFDDVPLAAAVGELNRYRRRPIGVADTQAGALRISGSFRTAETPAFTDALQRGFPVRVIDKKDTGLVIASR
jgi:transmembrane sensor